jgi:hypothetical protein
MNEEIGAEAAQFPEKEYINGIAFAVYMRKISFSFLPMCIVGGQLCRTGCGYTVFFRLRLSFFLQ